MSADDKKAPALLGFSVLKSYLPLLKGQGFDLGLTLALMLVSTAVTLAIPLFAGQFVDAIGASIQTASERVSAFESRHLLILGILLTAQMIGNFFAQIISARLGLRTSVRLRHKIFSHLMELPSLYFSDKKAGDISSRVTSDVGGIQYMLTVGTFSLLRAVITLVGAVALMVKLNPRLSSAVLLLIPATILLVRLFGSRLQRLSRTMYDELGKISSHVQETVGGIRSLKVYNAQNHECDRFDGMIEDYRKAGLKRAWLSAAFGSASQMSLWVCLLAVVIYGFILVAEGQTSGGQLVAFLLLAFRVAVPLSSLTSLYADAQGAIAAAGRLDEILALDTERIPNAPIPAPSHEPAAIRLENVTFSYPQQEEGQTVVDDLSVEIGRGQWVGLVGPSGAGKTTMAGLLLGLFPPTEGRILLDETPYSDLELTTLRSRMAWVAQDPVLYDASLADNIRFGHQAAGDQEVQAAAERAGVTEFSSELPDGLDTHCGERGSRLSGGQRQRVALARAFLRDPGVLVLDEPTSALDAASEESIRQSMRSLMANRTAIVIAHRFSLVKDLELILVMSKGKIVQSGNHAELMREEGLYRKLYELQQGEERVQ